MSVLGAVLIDNESLATARTTIATNDFYRDTHRTLFTAMCELVDGGQPIDTLTLRTWLRAHNKVEQITPLYVAELAAAVPSVNNVGYYAQLVREASVKRRIANDASAVVEMAFNGVRADSLLGEWQRRLTVLDRGVMVPAEIPWESLDAASVANEEYLGRVPVVDRTCFSSAVSMITGGKHSGKSTVARSLAIDVEQGLSFLGRDVVQGPVLYVASADEEMPARLGLMQLGWRPSDPLKFFGQSKIRSDDFDFLRALTKDIQRFGVVLVIVDMLFDFVRIDDEMSYAGTRRAVGQIQDVASATGAHICVVHHAPKNANIGDATVAALGSQGLAARVSPIILVRRFGPGVHSISSTAVRDPRGEAIPESRLLRHENGAVQLGGAFKNYMLGEVYAHRILDLLQAEEGSEITAPEVMEALDVNYEVARASLSFLYKNNLVGRSGTGKKGHPFRYAILLTELTKTNPEPENENTPLGRDKWGIQNTQTYEEQGRFGYKENSWTPPSSAESHDSPSSGCPNRKCRYNCSDPDLIYCPACGTDLKRSHIEEA
jgi:adenosyl cobinamide kinase/adenosyl cobinamide phosphate guanylyltransferase